MEITEKIKKHKEDVYFVVCAIQDTYAWEENVSDEDVLRAKARYVSSFEKYINSIEESNGVFEGDDFAESMMSALPSRYEKYNDEKNSFIVKLCLMLAYYYELLIEEKTGIKVDESDFLYGKSVDCVRREYHEKNIREVFGGEDIN